MGKIIKVRLTEYYPLNTKLEGGTRDRRGNPLYTLEDFVEGRSNYVSLACDTLAGSPGYVKEFKIYNYRVLIKKLVERLFDFVEVAEKPEFTAIDFRLVDTGGNFRGDNKVVEVSGYEPIDVCRRYPKAEQTGVVKYKASLSGLLTKMELVGK